MPRLPKKPQIPKFPGKAAAEQFKAHVDDSVRLFAESEAKRFQLEIRRQQFASFHAVPLAPRTVKYKEDNQLDHRVMIATKHYVDSIRVAREEEGGKITYHIGFDPNDRAENKDGVPQDITLNEVAYIQEHGSRAAHIPARPHWRVHLRALAVRATVLREQLLAEFIKELAERRKR
jgi:hypothetical protein